MVVPRLRRTERRIEQQGNREQDMQQRNENEEENPQGTTARESMSEQVMRLRMGFERGHEQPEIQAIYAQVNSITRQCTEIKREIENLRKYIMKIYQGCILRYEEPIFFLRIDD